MKKSKKVFKVILWILIISTIITTQVDGRGLANISALVWFLLFLILTLEIVYYIKYKEIL